MSDKGNVLVVDDDPRLGQLVGYHLDKWGYRHQYVGDAEGMRAALAQQLFAVLLLDLRLPDADGMELLPFFKDHFPALKIIVMTAHGSVDLAMDAVRAGAFDFLTKPVDFDRCQVAVRNALQLAQREEAFQALQGVVSGRERLGTIIGGSPAMQAVYEIIVNVSASDCSVLVTGETGTGKELVAAELHRLSRRSEREMVTVNCAAIPAELIESEMFGHVKGSFTGAMQDKIGAAERANGSTLFLDEVSELHVGLQAKLLRFLQDKQVTRVGGGAPLGVDVRIVAATNRDPLEAVNQGKLRQDLLYRLNVVRIHLPPLRERRSDIPLLAETFLAHAALAHGKDCRRFAPDAIRILSDADWPGNVRQLKNVITETVLMHHGETITGTMLPQEVRSSATQRDRMKRTLTSPPSHMHVRPLWEIEKGALQQTLLACQGNVAQSAKLLEIGKATLYRKIKRYKLATLPAELA